MLRHSSIGLTKSLWKADQRYIENYWSTIPGLWVHGDFAMRGHDGLYYILGRSDDTIKISGKRTGPAELEGHPDRHRQARGSGRVRHSAPGQGIDHRLCLRADAGVSQQRLADELSSALVAAWALVPPGKVLLSTTCRARET